MRGRRTGYGHETRRRPCAQPMGRRFRRQDDPGRFVRLPEAGLDESEQMEAMKRRRPNESVAQFAAQGTAIWGELATLLETCKRAVEK